MIDLPSGFSLLLRLAEKSELAVSMPGRKLCCSHVQAHRGNPSLPLLNFVAVSKLLFVFLVNFSRFLSILL